MSEGKTAHSYVRRTKIFIEIPKKLFFFGKSLPADVYSHVKGKNESFLPIAGNKQTLLPNLPSLSNSLL